MVDVIVKALDAYVWEPYIYNKLPSLLSPHPLLRDFWGIWFLVAVGGGIMYLLFSSLSYFLLYDKSQEKHHLFLKNQKRREMALCAWSIPLMGIITTPIMMLEIHGYSKIHSGLPSGGVPHLIFEIITFILFTDCLIYWIHRGLHHKWVYAYIHKPHHLWKVPTPYASHAFHPIDGYMQAFPYHLYVFMFPLNNWVYLALFLFVNFWTISIHDGDYRLPSSLNLVVNGAAHHTEHHLKFTCNYGQFFTLWDKIGRSYVPPADEEQQNKEVVAEVEKQMKIEPVKETKPVVLRPKEE
eukprot:TRINITY_DN25851_c0_g1_i1.p1 TRINITY_DN25851_c0_g1~~TRINITY_DN25851_c0_g1_i1.p1  ORF type:complete len:296 (+),score=27.61 TRINITY_DN25851_c0_g1_i1:104-991(+)